MGLSSSHTNNAHTHTRLFTHTHSHLEKFALSSKYHLQPRGKVHCTKTTLQIKVDLSDVSPQRDWLVAQHGSWRATNVEYIRSEKDMKLPDSVSIFCVHLSGMYGIYTECYWLLVRNVFVQIKSVKDKQKTTHVANSDPILKCCT